MANAFQKEGPVITPDNAPKPPRSEHEIWADRFNGSRIVAFSLFIIAALILQLYGAVSPLWGLDAVDSVRSAFCILCVTIGLGFVYWQACDQKFCNNKNFIVAAGAIIVHLGLLVLLYRHAYAFPDSLPLAKLAVPYIMAPLLVTVLLGPSLGTFAALAVSLLGVFYVEPSQVEQAHYLVISLVTGMLTVYLTRDVRSRKQLLRAGLIIGLVVLILSGMMGLIRFDDPSVGLQDIGWSIIVAFSVSIILSILISGIFPVIEAVFRIITPISWLELTDMNHRLLKRLQLEAPGTFHHSIVVAQLAESAAEAIGANGNYCRVVSYYHDIGKIRHPQYFIENLIEGEANPHDELTPTMSARIIIGHVSDGVEMARENKLNKPIMDAIQQHHGKSLAYFFYRKALDYRKQIEERVALGLAKLDDVPEVVETNFRYAGPVPQSREVGIVSLADIVESATRSLHRPTYEELTAMVDSVIKGRITDGHLNESRLTLGDIRKIRDSFITTLKNMRHTRVSYPKPETEAKAKSDSKPESKPETKVDPAPDSKPETGNTTPQPAGTDPEPPIETQTPISDKQAQIIAQSIDEA